METSGEYRLSMEREAVWEALMNPDVLSRCVPGCESFTQTGPNAYRAKVALVIGPVRATFDTEFELKDLDAPERYRLIGSSRGGAVGFGQGRADVHLEEPEPGVTVLSYSAAFQVGGRLAQIGSRLVQAATRKIADDFFAALVAELDRGALVSSPRRAARRVPGRYALATAVALLIITAALLSWWLAGASSVD